MRATRGAARRAFGGGQGEGPARLPGGRLFGEREGAGRGSWEGLWWAGMGGAFVLMAAALATRPARKPSAWARQELEHRQTAARQ